VTVHARGGPTTPLDKTRQLQRRLYLAAKRSRKRRFHALYDRIYRPDILWRAWQEVRRNGGEAGADGVTIEDIECQGVKEFLNQIRQDLITKTYRPKPVLRVNIPKPAGGQRPLGIPTVRDRVVQQACRIVIEPIFEANFQDTSYGYRPRRSAGQAVKTVKEALILGWWVIDADIEAYFETIDHELLMSLLKRRISDRRVLKMIHLWLKAGVLERGQWRPTEAGVPQGGVISPLLANIYLHVLDTIWVNGYAQRGKLVRYADDLVLICRTKADAKAALQALRQIATKLKLTLHPTKTRIVDMGKEGFDFLGFHLHKKRSKTKRKLLPYMWPSQKAMKTVRSKLRSRTSRRRLCESLDEVINDLNPIIRGWRNYFQTGNSTKKLQQLDRYLQARLRRLARARIEPRGRWIEEVFTAWIKESGLEYFYLPKIYESRT